MGASATVPRPRSRWDLFWPCALVSVLTSPLTVIWFALLGPLIAVVGAVIALVPHDDEVRERIVLAAAAVAAGTFVGPATYLGLSLLT